MILKKERWQAFAEMLMIKNVSIPKFFTNSKSGFEVILKTDDSKVVVDCDVFPMRSKRDNTLRNYILVHNAELNMSSGFKEALFEAFNKTSSSSFSELIEQPIDFISNKMNDDSTVLCFEIGEGDDRGTAIEKEIKNAPLNSILLFSYAQPESRSNSNE